jgi:hypothetical protein
MGIEWPRRYWYTDPELVLTFLPKVRRTQSLSSSAAMTMAPSLPESLCGGHGSEEAGTV